MSQTTQYAARLRNMPDGGIIEQVREYGEYMPRRRVAVCLIELRRRGAVTRQAAAQALDLYAPRLHSMEQHVAARLCALSEVAV